ncbi:MAG: hypothetical protein ACR2RB_09130 [Gammaproteobacteria bacterium]
MPLPDRVYGVDWSGARDAGQHIWIAAGKRRASHALLTDLTLAADLPDSGRAREQCLPVLEQWVAARGACAIGTIESCVYTGLESRLETHECQNR